ncbi:unnamed protein product [Caenorhabditis angaria]|uniref:heparosan-N-sulfate-glucuronate 5-epimerase n=1 Tax=Caenorhabditis angaria TaxID=860376 RepID=A0A9P1IG54_9PELO|nr:unnamed protein product [Caenorhabditis angaria]
MRVPPDKTPYNTTGPFGHFSTYSVESRDRVRCINGATNVPMSTQWDPKPYYYPIQIAQYGLQHYSKWLENQQENHQIILGEKSSDWKGAAGMSDTTERLFYTDAESGWKIVNISAEENLSNAGAYIYLDKNESLPIVEFEWRPNDENSSFTILAKHKQDDLLILLNYQFHDDSGGGKCVWPDDGDVADLHPQKDGQVSFSFSMDPEIVSKWDFVSRNVLVDVARALSSTQGRKKTDNVVLRNGDIRLVSLGFRGKVSLRQEVRQSANQHKFAFEAAANWLVKNQNEKGGWSVPVERSIADRKLVLAPGWHSAMAQGHAISLLSRANFVFPENLKYLEAAKKALQLFEVPSSSGGIRAEFHGKIAWFEEYPTQPGSFVLNGFLYSLIGLFDLSTLDSKSLELYKSGISSLRQLLPFYDTGTGTIYDLRHVFLMNVAPNLARWDYHAVHVYLLKWIAQIEKSRGEFENFELFNKTAERWIGYANGKRAKHN